MHGCVLLAIKKKTTTSHSRPALTLHLMFCYVAFNTSNQEQKYVGKAHKKRLSGPAEQIWSAGAAFLKG